MRPRFMSSSLFGKKRAVKMEWLNTERKKSARKLVKSQSSVAMEKGISPVTFWRALGSASQNCPPAATRGKHLFTCICLPLSSLLHCVFVQAWTLRCFPQAPHLAVREVPGQEARGKAVWALKAKPLLAAAQSWSALAQLVTWSRRQVPEDLEWNITEVHVQGLWHLPILFFISYFC